MPCEHYYHRGCIDKWLRRNATCPTCRCEVKPLSPCQINPNIFVSTPNIPDDIESALENETEVFESGPPSDRQHAMSSIYPNTRNISIDSTNDFLIFSENEEDNIQNGDHDLSSFT